MSDDAFQSEKFSQFSRALMLASWQVYSDLAYKKVWKLVEVLPCHALNIPYLICQEDEGCPKQILVPVRGLDELSLEDMEKLLKYVGKDAADVSTKVVVLAIVDADSTIVYYTLQAGIAVQDDRAVRAVELHGDDKRPMSHRKARGDKRKRGAG